jgi:hypothetical protein
MVARFLNHFFTQPFHLFIIIGLKSEAMKTILLFLTIVWFSLCATAQKNMEDVIYLKNGSKINGTIMQLFPDSTVRIKQTDGSIWVFPMKEISMIDKEEKNKFKANIAETKGYRFGLDAGFLIGSGDNRNSAPLSLQMIHYYHISPYNSVGIGSGLEFFRTTQAPLFADIRHYFNRKYDAPFFFLQGGGLFPLGSGETDDSGYSYKGKTGYMINSGFGFLFPMNEKSALTIILSYRYQDLRFARDYAPLPDYMRIEKMSRLNIRFGFILH